jgi:hypothetical protein
MTSILSWPGQVVSQGSRFTMTPAARQIGRSAALCTGVLVVLRVLGLG